MTSTNWLLLSGILSRINVKGDILDSDRKCSWYWVQIYIDGCKIVQSNRHQPDSLMLSWEWDPGTKIHFSPSSTVRVELYRGFEKKITDKFPRARVHVAQFEEQIEQLLENDSKSFALRDKKENTVAQINVFFSLSGTPNEFISDFMKKVDRDVANLKDVEGVSKRALLILGPVLQCTKTLMDTIADAHPILKISWKFISNVYDATQETEIQDQSIRDLAENLREMLATANEKLDLPKMPDAVDIIKEIGQHSLQIASIIHQYTHLSYNERVLNLSIGNMGKRITTCQSKLMALKARFYERVQLDTNNVVKEHQDMMKEVKKDVRKVQDDALAKNIFAWLWHSGSPIDFSKNYNEAYGKRQHETCSWFLEDERFGQWLHHPGFIWVYGKAGCGKTILMSLIIKNLPEADSSTGICYFFFDARDGQTDSQLHMKFIRSLVHQLCDSRHGGIPQEMVNLHTKCGSSQPLDEQLEETLRRILDGFDRVFIAIDALDECSDRQRTLDWVQKLLTKSDAQTDFHLIITSRHETDITDVFEHLRGDHIDVVNSDNTDIEEYIKAKMKSSKLQRLGEHRFKVESKLRDCADGSFRYVALMLAEVEKCPNLAMLQTVLTEMPKGLDEIYGRILSKCDSKKALDLRKFLQFLAFSKEDVTLDELAEIITVEFTPDNEPVYNPDKRYFNLSDVLELCGGLIVFNDKDYVKLSHFSVKEYLISSRVQDMFRLSETASHIEISKSLLSYLWEYHLDGHSSRFPLEDYAAYNWPKHVRFQGIDRDNIISKLVIRLLECGDSALVRFGWLWFKGEELLSSIRCPDFHPWPGGTWKELDSLLLNLRTLHWASVLGLVGVMEYLLGEVDDILKNKYPGTNVWRGGSWVYKKYCPELQSASYMGHDLAVEALIKHGVDVNALGDRYGTALQAASYKGCQSVVETLLKHGAHVNAVGGKYGTALHAASYMGHELVIKTLLKHGADVNGVVDEYGSALQVASYRGLHSVVDLLLNSGADFNAAGGKYGIGIIVASYKRHQLVVETLLKHGADVNAVGGAYGTALQAASHIGCQSVVETLLKHGAHVNAMGGQYGTALQAASYNRHQLVVETLLKHGADVNAVGGAYSTALQAASLMGCQSVVETLLKHGAHVNAMSGQYGTALHAASYGGHELVVETLLKHGADVNAVGGKYGTVVEAALHSKADKLVVDTLLNYGASLPDPYAMLSRLFYGPGN